MNVFVAISVALVTQAPPSGGGTTSGLSNDSVLSQHVREADGTSGQDTNIGNGIKTGHLQNGAVTDAKIGGTISASKVKYARVAMVSPEYPNTVGLYSDPARAMFEVATWCPAPPCLVKVLPGTYNLPYAVNLRTAVDIEGSGTNTTILYGAGGAVLQSATYDAATEVRSLTIEAGSGSGLYLDKGTIRLTDVVLRATGTAGVVVEAYGNNGTAVLDRVTVEVTGSSGARAVQVGPGATARITRSSLVVNGTGSATADGVWATNAATVDLRDSAVRVSNPSGYAYGVGGGSGASGGVVFTLTNVDVFADGNHVDDAGVWCGGGLTTCRIEGSRIVALTPVRSYVAPRIANTRLEGGPSTPAGAAKCIAVYDGNFDPESSICPAP